MRHHNFLDRLCLTVDNTLKTLTATQAASRRANPAQGIDDTLPADERSHVAGLMRVNHTGEVCAQALYQGQALTAKLPKVRAAMEHAAEEENDHLEWCKQRLDELDSHVSWLNPVWYAGSFAIGAVAGLAGDKWSLGFVAETEHQVVSHLQAHQKKLPLEDSRTRAILTVMEADEAEHAATARAAGAADLPAPVQAVMAGVSKVMTTTAYYI